MPSRQLSSRKTSRFRTKKKKEQEAPAVVYCLRIVDACLLGILFLAPLFFGGRHLLGRFVFIALACVAGVAWFLHQALLKKPKWTSTWANVLGLAALLLVSFQLVPLPTHWLEQLAPRNTELLTFWNNAEGEVTSLGSWKTLSLTPASTKIALATLVAYVLLFITAVGRLQKIEDVQKLMRCIAIAVIAMAAFGVLQYLTANGLFFWFYELPYSTTLTAPTGSFSTRNHFAHFLVLGVGPVLAWIVLHLRKFQQNKTRASISPNSWSPVMLALTVGLGLVALAIFMSLSRGGALALLTTGCVTLGIYYWRGLMSGMSLYGLALLGLLLIGLLSLSSDDIVAKRLGDFGSGSLESLDSNEGRRKIWKANLAAIQSGALFGSGAGSHSEIYPIYYPESQVVEFTHAENGPLQIGTENGVFGIVLLAFAILLVFTWCWQSLRRTTSERDIAFAGAAAASLIASLVHSCFDFVWFIPSCMSMTILLAACVLRLAQLNSSRLAVDPAARPLVAWSQSRWIGASAAVSCAAIWAVSVSWGPAMASVHWDKYLLVSAEQEQTLPLNASEEVVHEVLVNNCSRVEVMIFHLQRILAHDPYSARAQLRLSKKYSQLFDLKQLTAENTMSLDQIRDITATGNFSSSNALKEWLQRAFSENQELLYRSHFHARQALNLGPLQGEAYLQLAKLCFLEGRHADAIQAYLVQSHRVRPYSGAIYFEAGRLRFLLGEKEQAYGDWIKGYRDPGLHQKKIIALLSRILSAEEFLAKFQPDWSTLWPVWQSYRKQGDSQDWQALVDYGISKLRQKQLLKTREEKSYTCYYLGQMCRELGHLQDSIFYHQQAHTLAPRVYHFRRELGRDFFLAKQYQQAEPHLRWCLNRRPKDVALKRELIESTKSRLPQTVSSSSTPTHR